MILTIIINKLIYFFFQQYIDSISRTMQKDLRSRIDKNAKVLRFISRDQMFEKNRHNQKQQLSYLKILSKQEKDLILQSINGPIPSQLPSLSPTTISYYRRTNRAVFKTRLDESNLQLHPHMTYESLLMLAGIQEMHFSNYQSIVKQFETELERYVNCEFSEIRQMAMIAAGNKIIGREKDIQRIVEVDKKQMWVMINHIYERKMSSSYIFPYLGDHNQIIYKSLFQMTNTNDDDIIMLIMGDEVVLNRLVESLQHYNPEIKKYAIRIFGNIMAEKQDYVYDLAKHDILNHFYPFLNASDEQLRKDACWAISNFVFEKVPSTNLLFNTKMTDKLIQMLSNEKDTKIKIELCHIFSNLVAFADKLEVLKVIQRGHLLQRCGQFLQIEDAELIHVSLYLISKIVELGDHFADENDKTIWNKEQDNLKDILYREFRDKQTKFRIVIKTRRLILSHQEYNKIDKEY